MNYCRKNIYEIFIYLENIEFKRNFVDNIFHIGTSYY